jgi:hypothetical protein
VVEHFPVGRRLAFDSAKGRLWAVCAHCSRWNLTPLEERWEAVEECERLFAGRLLRAQTEHIGLTKLTEGLVLIRIGAPLKPEFAAWRYGDVFRRRFKRRLAWIGGGIATAGAGAAVALTTGLDPAILSAAPPMLVVSSAWIANLVMGYRDYLRTTYVPRVGHRPFLIFGANMKETDLEPRPDDSGWLLNLRHVSGTESLIGDAARRAVGIVLTRVNSAGATASTVRNASDMMAAAGGPAQYAAALAIKSRRLTADFRERRKRFRRSILFAAGGRNGPRDYGALPYLAVEERLALEMAVHEEEERRALEEEIGVLESAWREAEEIAAIADDLLTSAQSRKFIDEHRPIPPYNKGL